MKTAHRNVTLSLPESLLRRFRVYAAKRNQSMTALAAAAIQKAMESEDKDDEHRLAMRRLLEGMRNAKDLGTGGRITWKREDIYDRGEGRPWSS